MTDRKRTLSEISADILDNIEIARRGGKPKDTIPADCDVIKDLFGMFDKQKGGSRGPKT